MRRAHDCGSRCTAFVLAIYPNSRGIAFVVFEANDARRLGITGRAITRTAMIVPRGRRRPLRALPTGDLRLAEYRPARDAPLKAYTQTKR